MQQNSFESLFALSLGESRQLGIAAAHNDQCNERGKGADHAPIASVAEVPT